MVTCLLEAKVANITHDLDWLVESAGEETTVMVHAGTNNVGKCSHVVLAGRNLDSYTENSRPGLTREPSQKYCLFYMQGQLDRHRSGVLMHG